MNQKYSDFDAYELCLFTEFEYLELKKVSLSFLSNAALVNLGLDFRAIEFSRTDFNLVSSLFVFDKLNSFGKMIIFENILLFLLQKCYIHNFATRGKFKLLLF